MSFGVAVALIASKDKINFLKNFDQSVLYGAYELGKNNSKAFLNIFGAACKWNLLGEQKDYKPSKKVRLLTSIFRLCQKSSEASAAHVKF